MHHSSTNSAATSSPFPFISQAELSPASLPFFAFFLGFSAGAPMSPSSPKALFPRPLPVFFGFSIGSSAEVSSPSLVSVSTAFAPFFSAIRFLLGSAAARSLVILSRLEASYSWTLVFEIQSENQRITYTTSLSSASLSRSRSSSFFSWLR